MQSHSGEDVAPKTLLKYIPTSRRSEPTVLLHQYKKDKILSPIRMKHYARPTQKRKSIHEGLRISEWGGITYRCSISHTWAEQNRKLPAVPYSGRTYVETTLFLFLIRFQIFKNQQHSEWRRSSRDAMHAMECCRLCIYRQYLLIRA